MKKSVLVLMLITALAEGSNTAPAFSLAAEQTGLIKMLFPGISFVEKS